MKSGRAIFAFLFLSLALDASAQFAYVERSEAQFNAGSYSSATIVSGSGNSVELGLDYYGRGAGVAAPGAEEWFNGSWRYRQPVVITSAYGSSLSNYAVPVTVNTQALISAGRMNADGSDIRFTTSAVAGSSPALGYYIESGLNTTTTRIWVKSSGINTGSNTLYMYYGYTSASAASAMSAAFLMGDNFTAANGAAPSTNTWVNIESAAPLGSSLRDIQSNQLRIRFGSSLGLRHYGLRSVNAYTFASPRRYHAELNARSSGSDSWSNVTLCPTQYGYSYDEQHFLRFSIKHSIGGPTYTIEKSAYGIKTTLVAATSVGAGFHSVDFLITGATFKVMLDGVEVYSAANDLSFTNPFIYLEGSSAAAAYDDFVFDNVYVTPYASPEPVFDSVGQAQGRRYATGTFTSLPKDTTVPGTRVQNARWVSIISTGSTLGVEIRADNTNVALATFTSVANGADPVVTGRYVQYRLALNTTDPRYTATLSSLTLTYVSPPSTPSFAGAEAVDSWTVKWDWLDASAGQYQEEGFRIADTTGVIKGSVASGATYWIETGLNPNTPYTRRIYGYNAAGNGNPAIVTKYTFPAPPNVSCDKSVSTWLSGTLTCSNLAGFGANGVTYYRYVLSSTDTAPAWTGTETQWLSGTKSFSPGSGKYYLHVKSYNLDGDTLPGSQSYGPYWYDKDLPTVTGFSPSSAPWTNSAGFPVQVSVGDTGGSLLSLWRYKWTTTSDRPGSGWLPGGTSVLGSSSGTVSLLAEGTGAQWYLHVEPVDQAGNVGYLSAGPFKLDVIAPTGGVVINGGDAYTASRNVTLSLTYADSGSGVKEVAYRNAPGSFSTPELPQATTAWTLLSGDGVKTVYYNIADEAGNFISSSNDTIQLDSRTTLLGENLTARASGVMGEPAETFSAAAHLSWTPVANSPLNGKTITFVFNNSTQTAVTDSLGAASTGFFVPASSGTYNYSIFFSSDSVYSGSSTTGTITAEQRPSLIITEDVNTTANTSFIAKATLKDNYTGANISGASVDFLFEGAGPQSALTNASGVATVNYTAPGTPGFYEYTTSYAGSSVYGAKISTSGVGVGLRVTTLIVPGLTSLARDPFNAMATLMDGTNTVSGALVTFSFNGGASSGTAITNGIGVATITFTAPVSSGTYPYTAAFAEDGTYTASSGGANLTVNRRPLNLNGEAGLGYVNATFQARATLTDLGVGVEGKPVVFVFETSSATVTTDVNGVAATTFNSGALPRASECYYSFAGDAGYGIADSTKTVTVNRRPVALAASDASALLSSTFTAIASLQDIAFTATAIQGKTITFSFRGLISTAATDSLGIASVTYQTGISTGTYDYYASFDQDGTYLASNDTGTVTMNKRPSVVSAYPKFVFAQDAITAVADLKDGVTGAVIGGETMIFNYNGQAQSTTTAVSGGTTGRATAVYVGTGVAGAYSYFADFPGNALYSAGASTAAITVTARSVNLSAFPQTAILGTTTSVTAEFRDGSTNAVVANKNIKLVFQSSTVFNLSNSSGVANAVFNAPASTGVFNWLAEFAGDQAYAAASSTGTITINRRAFTLTPISTTKYVWDSIFLSVTAYDGETPLSGKAFNFYFRSSTQPATTNASGVGTSVAFSSISVPGNYGFIADFAGDANYSAQSGSSTVTVIARPSSLNLGPVSAISNSTPTLTATLLDSNDGARLMGNKTVVFTLQGATFTVTTLTNAAGVATAAFPVSSIPGPYTYSVTFAGNTNYAGTSGNNTLTVTKRPSVLEMADYTPPAGSTFTASAVLKDFTSGAVLGVKTVTFNFLGVDKATTTTALGSASTSYLALVSTQSYPISATFAGDATYLPTSINKTVFPGKRNTTLQTSDMLSAVAKDTFTVTARLSDYDLGTYIAGSTITFTFSGSTSVFTATAYTNSTGTASAVFMAPTSTGNYTYTASFAATPLYNSNINTSAVLVNRRNITIEPWDLNSIPANSTFTATALLRDGALTISTKTLSFVFVATKTAITNNIGIGSVTFTSPSSTGTFTYQVTFADGDPLYKPGSAYGNVGVIVKPTVLEVLDVPDAVVNLKFIGTAKLRDVELGELVLTTKTITIVFGTNTVNAITDAGVSTAPFIAPATVGTYQYTATFAGDSIYGYSQSTGTITVSRRPVLFALSTDPVTPYTFRAGAVQSSFTITGILQDGKEAGLNLANKTIRFVFRGVEKTGITNAAGIASTTYSSPLSSGPYAYYAYFDGDLTYDSNEPDASIKSVTFIPRPTYITGGFGDGNLIDWVYTFTDYTPSAYLNDGPSFQVIQGLTASFESQGATRTGVTSVLGLATSNPAFTWISTAATYSSTVTFAGNATYAPSFMTGSVAAGNSNGKIRVYSTPARIELTDINEVYPDQDVIVSGTAYDYVWNRAWARPYLVNKQVRYRVSSTPCTMPACLEARTWGAPVYGNVNSSFIATATVHTPLTAGDYPIEWYFANDQSFYMWNNGENQRILRVGRRITLIERESEPFVVGALMPINVKVTLNDTTDGIVGINSKNLEVVLIATKTFVTGSAGPAGKVNADFTGMAVGTYTYIARFPDGDPTYMPTSRTGTVVVEKNTTVLTADDVPNVPSGNTFTARAVLGVVVGTSTLYGPGMTVNFVFTSTGAPINLSGVTNALGVATVTYGSPYTPGSYNYTASLPEDANNKASSDLTNNVQVVKRITLLAAVPSSVYILDSFISTATLIDTDLANAPLSAKPVSFILHKTPDLSSATFTNISGTATVTYLSPPSSGTFLYSATYPGDTLYAVSSDTKAVTVSRRVTSMDAIDITTPTNSAFTLYATLRDVTSTLTVSTTLAGRQIKFVFNNNVAGAVYGMTNATGTASASFTAPAVSAIYPYSATYEGDLTYDVSTTFPKVVNARKRLTSLSGTNVLVPAGTPFTAQAVLTDVDAGGQQLAGFPITFNFNGVGPQTGITSGVGLGSTTFTSPLSTGTYNFTAQFAGDATYEVSSDLINDVEVNVASTTLSVLDGTATVNDLYYATATLKGSTSGAGIANKLVSFTYNGVLQNPAILTNSNGQAVKSFLVTSTGPYRLDVAFIGDTAFFASASSATITVGRRTSGMTMPDVSTEVLATFIATATLRDLSVTPSTWVAGRTVDFLFEGTPKTGVTNSVGVATASFTAPLGYGTYKASATFIGDAIFGPTTAYADVVIAKFLTSITVDSGTVTALEVFNATATLRYKGGPLQNKVVQFTYKGSTLPGQFVTDVNGKAFVQYNAGTSSGPWRLDANFDGSADPSYNTSPVSSNTITVARRACLVTPDNISISVFDAFTATATFRDVANSTSPVNKVAKISFAWTGSTVATTGTDGAGKVYYSTDTTGAPVSSGTYKVEAFYTGDATFAPSLTSTATVTVAARPSQLSLADVNTMIGRVFTATATLKNDSVFIANKSVRFTFEGQNFDKKTDAGGIAVATFTVTISTGATQINAVFNGDATYFTSNAATATVTAVMRPTTVFPVAATAIADNVFIATATLKDIDNSTVPAKSIGFVFEGTTFTATTNSLGVASVTLTANVSTGTYNLKVYFDGDYKFVASSSTLVLTVNRRPTSMTPFANVTVNALDLFYATATLKDMTGLALTIPKPVYFVFQGSTFARTTDVLGVAFSTWAAPAASGAYSVGAYFDGDVKYAPSSSTILVTNLQRPSGITLNALTAMAGDVFGSTATLADLNNAAFKVSTRPVTFTFSWTASTGATTNAIGVATASYIATLTANNNYTLTGTFAGDATYASTTTAVIFPVTKRSGFVTGIYVSTRVLDTFTVTGLFKDNVSSAPVSGRTVNFYLQGGSTLTATTDGAGMASRVFTAHASSGTYNFYTSGLADATYNATSIHTTTVTFVRRDSSITLTGPTAVIINSSFTATGTMFDTVNNSTVPAKSIAFLFQAATVTVPTNALGVSSHVYTANTTSGTYALQASFAGDATYNPTVSTRSVNSLRYPTTIVASSITVTMNEVLTATATLRVVAGSTVATKALLFTFQAAPFTAVTNGVGVAYATYTTVGVSSGPYLLPVSFAGDALYDSTNTNIPVLVAKRPALITATPVTVNALDIFTATATLVDERVPATKIVGEVVTFEFLVGASTFTNTGTTNGSGIATSTFTAPAAFGSYKVTTSFGGNLTYYPRASTTTITAVARAARLMQDNSTAAIGEVFRTTATLVDLVTSQVISTKTVTFSYAFGASSAALTDLAGKSSIAFTAPASSGTSQMDSVFAGDATYALASSTGTLTVIRRPLVLTPPAVTGVIDEVFRATVTVTDGLDASAVTGRNIAFVFSGSTFTVATGGAGVAVSTFSAPSSSGTFYAGINFYGDSRFLPNGTTVQVTVDRRPSAINLSSVTVRAGMVFTATATVVDVLNPAVKVNNRTVSFLFAGSTFTAQTNINGIAVSTFMAPSSSGTAQIGISFAGDARYQASASTAAVAVLRRLSLITFEPVTIKALNVLTATATLTDLVTPAVFVAGRDITFTFSSANFVSGTDAGGMAVSTFTGKASSGTYKVEANFAGDAFYEASYSSGSVIVIQRPAGLTVDNVAAFPFETFPANGVLLDSATLGPVAGRALKFTLGASSAGAVTSGAGAATALFMPPSAVGSYNLVGNFAGDATYAPVNSTGTVLVQLRPTAVTTFDFAGAIALDPVFVGSMLTDVRFGTPIVGQDMIFTFDGQVSTGTTDPDGIAVGNFMAPASSGTHYYTAAFPAGSVYAAASSTGSVTVITRDTRMIVLNTNADAGQPFTLSAQLVDAAKNEMQDGYNVSTATIEFKFKDSPNAPSAIATAFGITNSVGVATVTFTQDIPPGVYYYSARFYGDETYSPSSGTAMVKMGLLTSLVAFNVETYATKSFKVNAKLTDYLSTPLDDKQVHFKFLGAPNSGLTGVEGFPGIAASTFTAPAAAGTYLYTAEFRGDTIYSASNATATVTVVRSPSVILAYPTDTTAASSFTVTAVLKDALSLENIGGRDLFIAFNGSTATVNTNAVTGSASTQFFAALSSGTYSYYTWFDGDATFAGTVSTGVVTIALNNTSMVAYNVTDITATSTFTATALIKDGSNNPVPGLNVNFFFDVASGAGVTNAAGIATTVFTAPPSSGTFQYTAVFDGDAVYVASNDTGTVTVGPRPTIILAPAVSSKLGSPLVLTITLMDLASQTGIAGKTVDFLYEGTPQSAVTDSFGVSSVSYGSAFVPSTGTYAYSASFTGDGLTYSSSFSSAPVTIALNLTTIEARTNIDIKIYESLGVEATLRDSGSLQLIGLPVTFTLEGVSQGGTTDVVGRATTSFSTLGLISTGAYNYSAEFPGDTLYVASSDTSNVVNVLRRDTLLDAKNNLTTPTKTFIAEARLTDNVNGSVRLGSSLAGKAVILEFFDGLTTSSASVLTNVSGVSTTSFMAPVTTGTYFVTARFDGDPLYIGFNSTGTITVEVADGAGLIKTKIRPEHVDTYITHVFIATATFVTGGEFEPPIPNKTLVFSFFNGISTFTQAGITNALGVATAAFTAPGSSGTFTYTASFAAGDAEYAAAIGTSTIDVSLFPDTLTAQDLSAYIGENFTARAVLRDDLTLDPVVGRTIVFEFFNGVTTSSAAAVTSSTGSAEAVFSTPLLPGNYTYLARFAGDAMYKEALDTGAVLIASLGSSTFLVGYDVFIGTGEVFAATATLTAEGYGVPNKAVTLSFGGITVISTTNAKGEAYHSFTAPASSGVYVSSASFAGDLQFNMANSTATVKVVLRKQPDAPVFKVEVASASVSLVWAPVVAKPGEVLAGYTIEGAASLRGVMTSSVTVSSGTLGFTVPVDPDAATYLRIKTNLADEQASGTTLTVEIPRKIDDPERVPNYYYMSKDSNALVKIPGKIMDKLSGTAAFTVDIKEKTEPGFLKSYDIKTVGLPSAVSTGINAGDRKGVKMSISYPQQSGTGTSAASGQMALYWNNGVEWIKLGGELDVLAGEVYTYARSFGQFAIKAAPLASAFSLTKVVPRIFSPDEPDPTNTFNRATFAFENPGCGEVTIRIFDITGALVRRNIDATNCSIMYWNGKDQAGTAVKGGIYIYQIEAGEEVVTGTVVVAK